MNTGSKQDKDGNDVPWWTQKSINEYENIMQCFIDQYNEYLVPGLEHKNIQVSKLKKDHKSAELKFTLL